MIVNAVVRVLLRLYDAGLSIMRLSNTRRPSQVRTTVEVINKLLGKEGPVVLEIGSHYGWTTREFLRAFRNISIYCFEPDPRNIAAFKARVRDDRCVLVQAAVSGHDGEAYLHMSSGWPSVPRWAKVPGLATAYFAIVGREWTASSSIKESVSRSGHHPWLLFDNTVRVRTLKLDSWVREKSLTHVDFMLIDVQGAEREVIGGATETLESTDYVQTEYGETATYPGAMDRDETVSMMEQHAFELVPEYSMDASTKIGDLLFRNKARKLQ